MSLSVSFTFSQVFRLDSHCSVPGRRWRACQSCFKYPFTLLTCPPRQTAGLTLAARLTEDPNVNVVVLEAGEANIDDPELRMSYFCLVCSIANSRQTLSPPSDLWQPPREESLRLGSPDGTPPRHPHIATFRHLRDFVAPRLRRST